MYSKISAIDMAYFGELWQADTCYFPYLENNKSKKRTYLMMIIDDYSRLIVYAKLFFSDSAKNFREVFKTAVKIYGIPHKLYLDNGSPYINKNLKLITGDLGTVKIHAKPRDGAAKAKVERTFRTLKETWLYTINTFVVLHTVPLVRPHGISCISFLVYSQNLCIRFTFTFWPLLPLANLPT